MPTYTAQFCNQAQFATYDFEADSPEQALQLARELWEQNPGAIEFASYDMTWPLEEIEIFGPNSEPQLAVWQNEDLFLRLAARELLQALEAALVALNTAPRFKVPALNTDSYKIAALCEEALANAKPPAG